jgi:arsenate reductase-like glutaredoxin family protein
MLRIEDNKLFSRIVIEGDDFKFKKSFLSRVMSAFYLSQKYNQENENTLLYFQNYLKKNILEKRLIKILSKANLDLDDCIYRQKALTESIVYKILLLVKDVKIEDILEYIQAAQDNLDNPILSSNRLDQIKSINDLTPKEFDEIYKFLSNSLDEKFVLKQIENISGKPSKFLSRIFFDFFLATHERLSLCENNDKLTKFSFYEKLCKVIVLRLMDVGTIIKAYNNFCGPNYYRVAARIITAEGSISYILFPASTNMHLEKIRVFQGSGFRSSSIDALSFYVTDFEKNIGESAFLSNEEYEKYLKEISPVFTELGHSIGGCIAQYRAARYPIKKLYLYNSPGIPNEVNNAFNERVSKIKDIFKLYIRRTKNDIVEFVGDCHLGYLAPENVDIDYQRYIKQTKVKIHPHNLVFSTCFGKIAIQSGDISELNNLSRSYIELFRRYLGGNVISPFFRILRYISRSFINSNALKLKGLYLEDMNNLNYNFKHIA